MKEKINVSIIILDTLRLDTFKKIFAGKSLYLKNFNLVTFDNCVAPASWTLPSHASMFTGMYPSEHNCHETKEIKSLDIDRIKLKKETILHRLKGMGYSTFGISANPYVHPVYGFTGFDTFMEESYFTDIFGSIVEVSDSLKPMVSKYRNIYGNDVVKLSKAIMKDDPKLFLDLILSATVLSPKSAIKKMKAKLIDGWPIEKGGKNILKRIGTLEMKEPFFLFVNFMEAHDPYVGVQKMDFNWATPFLRNRIEESLIKKWKYLYQKASELAYKYGTELIKQLIARFVENQTIILTSDHGQALNEHGFVGHGTVIFDEVVKVPLLVIMPKKFEMKMTNDDYQSLVNIPNFVLAAIKDNKKAIEKLSSKSVYSETFSIPANITHVKGIDKKKMVKFDKYEKRVFN